MRINFPVLVVSVLWLMSLLHHCHNTTGKSDSQPYCNDLEYLEDNFQVRLLSAAPNLAYILSDSVHS